MLNEQLQKNRTGKITASSVYKLMGAKGLETETAKTYIREVAWCKVTGQSVPEVTSRSIEWGNENEGKAIKILDEYDYLEKQKQCFDDYVCATIDAYDNDRKIIYEIKCPYSPANSVEMIELSSEDVKKSYPEYYWQIAMQFSYLYEQKVITNLCVYDPRISISKVFIKQLTFSEEDITTLSARIFKATEKIEEIVKSINEKILDF